MPLPPHDLGLKNARAQLAGRVFAITGAGSGLGRAVSQILAMDGAALSLADLSEAGLQETKKQCEELGAKSVLIHRTDVTKTEDVQAWMEVTVSTLGQLDGVCNAAGVAPESGGSITELSDKDWNFIVAWAQSVNMSAVMVCMREEFKHLQDHSSVVNISSIAGMIGLATSTAYSTSKAGVISMTKVAAKDYGSRGIRCNAVCPGAVKTAMFEKCVEQGLYTEESVGGSAILNRVATPEEMAQIVSFLLSDASSFITGAVIVADGLFKYA